MRKPLNENQATEDKPIDYLNLLGQLNNKFDQNIFNAEIFSHAQPHTQFEFDLKEEYFNKMIDSMLAYVEPITDELLEEQQEMRRYYEGYLQHLIYDDEGGDTQAELTKLGYNKTENNMITDIIKFIND